MKNMILIGASGHGRTVAEIAEDCGYGNISFLDLAYPNKKTVGKWPVSGIPSKENLVEADAGDIFVAIGNNRAREKTVIELGLGECPAMFHASSIVSRYAKINGGTLVAAGAIINTGAQIGSFVIVNTGASVDHDCVVADFVHISPGARLAGGVSIGARTWIGIGAVVRENIKIGKDVVIGAGAAVVKDIVDGSVVGGVPARPFGGKS